MMLRPIPEDVDLFVGYNPSRCPIGTTGRKGSKMKKYVYATEMLAMVALAGKKDQRLWTIKKNDNGWFYLVKK